MRMAKFTSRDGYDVSVNPAIIAYAVSETILFNAIDQDRILKLDVRGSLEEITAELNAAMKE